MINVARGRKFSLAMHQMKDYLMRISSIAREFLIYSSYSQIYAQHQYGVNYGVTVFDRGLIGFDDEERSREQMTIPGAPAPGGGGDAQFGYKYGNIYPHIQQL